MNNTNNMNNVNKPFTVVFEDFKQGLANLINDSGIPAVIIETVLQNYLNEIKNVAARQYQAEVVQYEKALKEARDKSIQDVECVESEDNQDK